MMDSKKNNLHLCDVRRNLGRSNPTCQGPNWIFFQFNLYSCLIAARKPLSVSYQIKVTAVSDTLNSVFHKLYLRIEPCGTL